MRQPNQQRTVGGKRRGIDSGEVWIEREALCGVRKSLRRRKIRVLVAGHQWILEQEVSREDDRHDDQKQWRDPAPVESEKSPPRL
jgi:hypothetical protein